MQRRHQVFVSSTFKDLQDERREVLHALLELGCIPSAMEYFPASDKAAWDLIRGILRPCDYYILILGGRYGSLTPDGVSFTEKEYELAVELGIPVLAFLHADPDSLPRRGTETDPEAIEKLRVFRRRLQDHLHTKQWSSVQQLGGVVSRALAQSIATTPRPGWIRADSVLPLNNEAQVLERYAQGERDFRWARLSGMDLHGATLDGADFSKADMDNVNLEGASLVSTRMWRSSLREARLVGANLKRADLQGADLWKATLSYATVDGLNLSGANLRDSIILKTTGKFGLVDHALFDFYTFSKSEWSDQQIAVWIKAGASVVCSHFFPKSTVDVICAQRDSVNSAGGSIG